MMAHDPRCEFFSVENVVAECRRKVAEHGWMAMGIFGSAPYSYTVGMWQTWAHPELVIAGIDPAIAKGLLDNAVTLVEQGQDLTDGIDRDEIAEGFAARFRLVTRTVASFAVSDRFYGGMSAPRLQLIWPDPSGRWPGEAGVRRRYERMQDLTDMRFA